MPVMSNGRGGFAYVSEDHIYSEHPRDFLDETTYAERLELAKSIILRVVLSLREKNDTVYDVGSSPADFADFIDGLDGSRSRRARLVSASDSTQRFAGSYRIRSPQHMARRRRRLFSLDDIEGAQLLFDCRARGNRDYESFLDLMRWHLIHDAAIQMIEKRDMWCMNDIWQIRPMLMDHYRSRTPKGRKGQNSVKVDDRSFHGRPNRDRGRMVA